MNRQIKTKRLLTRVMAVALALLLSLSGLEPLAYAKGAEPGAQQASAVGSQAEAGQPAASEQAPAAKSGKSDKVGKSGESTPAGSEPAQAAKSDKPENTKKDEVVYVSIGPDGGVTGTYVVNSFRMDHPGTIRDYGDYQSVENLSTTDQIQRQGQDLQVDVKESGQFFYQGNAPKAELPWLIDMTYKLDGKSMKAEDMAGKPGHVEIHGRISPRPEANPMFTDYYLLMLTMNFDARKVKLKAAEGGQVAYEGTNLVVNYIGLPGEDLDFTLEMDTDSFAMGAYNLAGIPFNVGVDIPDISAATDGLRQLEEAIGLLDLGTGQLAAGGQLLNSATLQLYQYLFKIAEGAGEASLGSAQLAGGEELFQMGLATFGDGVHSLVDILQQAGGSFQQLKEALIALSDLQDKLEEGTGQYQEGLTKYVEGVDTLADQLNDLVQKLQELLGELPPDFNPWKELNPEQQEAFLNETISSLQKAVETWNKLNGLTKDQKQDIYQKLKALDEALGAMEEELDALLGDVSKLLTKYGEKADDPEKQKALQEQIQEDIQPIILDTLKGGLTNFPKKSDEEQEEILRTLIQKYNEENPTKTMDADAMIPMFKTILGNPAFKDDQMVNGLAGEIAKSVAGKMATSYQEPLKDLQKELTDLQTQVEKKDGLKEQIHKIRTLLESILGDEDNPFPQIKRLMDQLQEPMANLQKLLQPDKVEELKKQLKAYMDSLETPGDYKQKLDGVQDGLGQLKKGGEALTEGIGRIHLGQQGLAFGQHVLNAELAKVDLAQLQKLSQLNQAVDALVYNHGRLAMGSAQLAQGLDLLSGGMIQYMGGFGLYDQGLEQFMTGVNRLHDGTSEMNQQMQGTSDLVDAKMDKAKQLIDVFTQEGFTMSSFVSPDNSNVGLVQFVYMSQPVEKEEEPAPLPEKQEKTFWEKIKDLFS